MPKTRNNQNFNLTRPSLVRLREEKNLNSGVNKNQKAPKTELLADSSEVFDSRLGILNLRITPFSILSSNFGDNFFSKPAEGFAPSEPRIPSLGLHFVAGLQN
ncbi:MAG: hypothetical protein HYW34_03060 [Candidatus Brennerbacteria bacterium]|nr:hypothetical protein [Candidatus Brennerbacteria bacterium]